jgi:hypothetical protein
MHSFLIVLNKMIYRWYTVRMSECIESRLNICIKVYICISTTDIPDKLMTPLPIALRLIMAGSALLQSTSPDNQSALGMKPPSPPAVVAGVALLLFTLPELELMAERSMSLALSPSDEVDATKLPPPPPPFCKVSPWLLLSVDEPSDVILLCLTAKGLTEPWLLLVPVERLFVVWGGAEDKEVGGLCGGSRPAELGAEGKLPPVWEGTWVTAFLLRSSFNDALFMWFEVLLLVLFLLLLLLLLFVAVGGVGDVTDAPTIVVVVVVPPPCNGLFSFNPNLDL